MFSLCPYSFCTLGTGCFGSLLKHGKRAMVSGKTDVLVGCAMNVLETLWFYRSGYLLVAKRREFERKGDPGFRGYIFSTNV